MKNQPIVHLTDFKGYGVPQATQKTIDNLSRKDRVIFRKWTKEGDVIAFLPDNSANRGMVDSYQHIGQHGEADYYGLLAETKLATPEEYKDLLAELQSLGYNLRVVKRLKR